MDLYRAKIHNYRSIKSAEVEFPPTCRILVGVNEGGKSNILQALALLSPDHAPAKSDIRNPTKNEDPPSESFVDFEFALEEEEVRQVSVYTREHSICLKQADSPILKGGSVNMSYKDVCAKRCKCYYRRNLLTEEASWNSFAAPENWRLLTRIKKVADTCAEDITVKIDGKQRSLANYTLVDADGFPDIPPEAFEDASIDDLLSAIDEVVTKRANEVAPDVLLWTYDEGNLLPASIQRAQFISNPSSCVPLWNMFKFAGIEDVSEAMKTAEAISRNRLLSLLQRVAERTTNHFRRVWPEYKGISFSLQPDGNEIVCGIQDSANLYDLSERSDGFKRFSTFLLLISLQTSREKLHNTLILIDEPEISLHPPSAEALRDELLRISKNNTIVFSTHSPFMVDRAQIPRHYIVSKAKEETSVAVANQAQVKDEEVLYHALGWSIFSALEAKNLVFEGWRDKRLFDLAIRKTSLDRGVKRSLSSFGRCHAKGAKDIKTIAALLELGQRDCFAISDTDAPAKEQKEKFLNERRRGTWLTYDDIWPECPAVTGEDFLSRRVFLNAISAAAQDHTELASFGESDLPDGEPRISLINTWLSRRGMNRNKRKRILDRIKSIAFDKIRPQDIEATYLTLLEKLDEYLTAMPT